MPYVNDGHFYIAYHKTPTEPFLFKGVHETNKKSYVVGGD